MNLQGIVLQNLHMASAGASPLPSFDFNHPLNSIVSTLLWISLGVVAPIYYLIWLLSKLKGNMISSRKWVFAMLSSSERKDAEDQSRASIRARLGTTLMHTSAQILTGLRLTVVAVVAWYWWRLHSAESNLALKHSGSGFEPHLSWLLSIITIAYFIGIDYSRRLAERAQKDVEEAAKDAPLTGPGGVWTRTLKDTFFWPAMMDVTFLSVAGFCLPTLSNELHLALLVPMLSAWLFRNAFRVIILWLFIVLYLLFNWYWSGYCECKHHWDFSFRAAPSANVETAHESDLPKKQPSDESRFLYGSVLFDQTCPRVGFWLVMSLLMIVMRAVRRETEDQAAFFHGLAEAMPFEVFVKDSRRRFVYANHKMLTKLRKLSGNANLTVKGLQELDDEKLNVEPHKREHYKKIDEELLNNVHDYYEQMENSYELGSIQKILTIKVPIGRSNSQGEAINPRFVLGLCRDPLGDSDPYFYMAIVGTEVPHCFFSKHGGKFVWANESFALDAGLSSPLQVVGKSDDDLYTKICSDCYINDDSLVTSSTSDYISNPLVKEEWHEPKGKTRRRVHVAKMASTGPDGDIVGVRGYFRDIHASFLRCLSIDYIISMYLEKVIVHSGLHKIKIESKLGGAKKT